MANCDEKGRGVSSPFFVVGGAAPVEARVNKDGRLYLTLGEYPSCIQLAMSVEVADKLKYQLGFALQDAQQTGEDAVQLDSPHVCVPTDDDESGVDLTLEAGRGPDPFRDNSAVQGGAQPKQE